MTGGRIEEQCDDRIRCLFGMRFDENNSGEIFLDGMA